MSQRYIVLASGSGSNFQAFIDASQSNKLAAECSALICNRPDAYCLQRAADAGIPSYIINHQDYSDRQSFDVAMADVIDSYQPDFIILAGFMRILSEAFTLKYHGKLLNIHPSLLPKYKGLNTHQRAIEAGDAYGGVTVHFVTAELDGGPSIIQAKVAITESDDANSLAAKVLNYEHIIYPLAAQWLCQQRIKLIDNKVYFDDKLLPESGINYPPQ